MVETCSVLLQHSGSHLPVQWGWLGSSCLVSVPGKVSVLNVRQSNSMPELCLKMFPTGKNTPRTKMAISATPNPVSEFEKELESDMMKLEQEDGVNKSPVELLECLEKEAIMGEDVGREPLDYNRRAIIFDKSSKVFQAMKESNSRDSTSQKE